MALVDKVVNGSNIGQNNGNTFQYFYLVARTVIESTDATAGTYGQSRVNLCWGWRSTNTGSQGGYSSMYNFNTGSGRYRVNNGSWTSWFSGYDVSNCYPQVSYIYHKNTATTSGLSTLTCNHLADGSLTVDNECKIVCSHGSTGWMPKDGTYTATATATINNVRTVSYNANGGNSTPSAQRTLDGTAITLASAITKNASVSTSTITTSYNANGGNSTPNSQNSTKTITTPQNFSKWCVNSTSGTGYSAGASYTPTGSNVTMYATWSNGTASTTYSSITLASAISKSSSVTTYTISYNVNGGSSSAPANSTATRTEPYSFNGWHEGSATGTSHAAGASWAPTSSKTLYAGWNTGTATTTQVTLPAAPTRTGYTFNGWYTATSGGTRRGGAGDKYTPTASEVLYAQWSGVTSTVTFNGNGASTNTFAQQTYTYGVSGQSFVGTITRQGYTMLGWSHSSTATTQTYSTNSGVSNDWINGHQGTQILYAVWKANTYTLTFNANGGTVSSSTKSVTYGTSYTDLPKPTRPGYIFRGWFANCVNSAGSAINFGRAYKYVSSMSVHFVTYSTDYSGWGSYRIISCTEGGGWNIENGSGYPRLAVYDETGAGYKTQNFSITWANITPGFHQWDIVLNNKVVTAYLDGVARATITMAGTNIKYHSINSIWVGAEANATDTGPTTPYLNGYIGNIVIANSTTRITNLGRQRFTAPAQNITLYALWEPYLNIYIKGKSSGWVLLKDGYNWQN